jgi:glycosyltransferase involved in cell wall biosynthesis
MLNPKVTVGLPVYNDEKYLKKAIESVLEQTFTDFELIIVNDGSEDTSMDIVHSFKDPRIQIIDDGKNSGLPKRLNQITKLAKGEYLARMDSDDIMLLIRLEEQISILEKNNDIDVLGSNVITINEDGIKKGIRYTYNEIKPGFISCTSFIHPTIMGKTEWCLNNPYSENVLRAQDAELWRRTSTFSSFMLYKKPLLLYREIGGSYYKKYFKCSVTFKKLFLEKKEIFWLKKWFKYITLGFFYMLFSFFNAENKLLSKRNQVKF